MKTPRAAAEIAIQAPIMRVWFAMIDVKAYPSWNPFIVRIEGISGVPYLGQSMKLHVRWNDGNTTVSPEQIVTIAPPVLAADGRWRATLAYAFRGPLHALRLVRGTRMQVLEQEPGGPTVYRTYEEFTGLLARFVPLAKVQDGFARHAVALKTRAESMKEP